jgi:signal transduction histidine kinase
VSVQHLIFKQKQCLILTCRDISKIKEHAKLAADNKLLQLMSSSVSHEMITPIKCIVTMIESLQKSFENDPELIYKTDLIATTSQMLLN